MNTRTPAETSTNAPPPIDGGGFFVPHDLEAPLRGTPTGPLAGLQVAVKDLFDIAGMRTGGGNPDWLAAQPPATCHAAAVQRLLDAGASICGRTICDEFFYSVAGVNAHYGTPANLRAPGRLPGGSSSGSAAATAAGACDIGLGSDTGGSVRVPASFCGLYGIRTTHGRVDLTGGMEMAPTFDTVGWFSAGPGPLRQAGSALLQGLRADATVTRLIVADDAFAEADPPVAAMLRMALDRLANALPAPQSMSVAPGGLDGWRETFRIIQGFEIWQAYGDFVRERKPRFGPGVAERMQAASQISATEADDARAAMAQARAHIRSFIEPGTVLVLPSAPCVAPPVNSSAAELDSFRLRTMRITCIAGLGGLPQVSLPAGTVGGLPAGLSLVGWPGADETLLDLASSIARHLGIAR